MINMLLAAQYRAILIFQNELIHETKKIMIKIHNYFCFISMFHTQMFIISLTTIINLM